MRRALVENAFALEADAELDAEVCDGVGCDGGEEGLEEVWQDSIVD